MVTSDNMSLLDASEVTVAAFSPQDVDTMVKPAFVTERIECKRLSYADISATLRCSKEVVWGLGRRKGEGRRA